MEHKTLLATIANNIGCNHATATKLSEAFVGVIASEAAECNAVAIPGFGTFSGVKHEEEIVKDLSTGKRFLLPPSVELTFAPSNSLNKSVAKTKPQS